MQGGAQRGCSRTHPTPDCPNSHPCLLVLPSHLGEETCGTPGRGGQDNKPPEEIAQVQKPHPQAPPSVSPLARMRRYSCPEEECLGPWFPQLPAPQPGGLGRASSWGENRNCRSLSPHIAILKVLLFLVLLTARCPAGRWGGRGHVCLSHLCVPGRVSGSQYWWEMKAPSPTWRLRVRIPATPSRSPTLMVPPSAAPPVLREGAVGCSGQQG